jgi:AcrR family transcriptional regulator
LQALLATLPEDPREQLRAIVRYYSAKVNEPAFRGCPLSNTAVEFPEPGHPGRVVLEACKAEMRAMLVEISRKLPVKEPEALADGLLLIIEGAMASHQIFGSQGPSAALISTGDALIAAYAGQLHSA